MVAQSQFSHKQLQGLSCNQMQYKLLTEKDINWNNFSSSDKQGVFIRKERIQIKLDEERLSKIPEDKRPEGGIVTRGRIVEIDMPNFLKVTNRNEVIFDGEDPILSKDTLQDVLNDID